MNKLSVSADTTTGVINAEIPVVISGKDQYGKDYSLADHADYVKLNGAPTEVTLSDQAAEQDATGNSTGKVTAVLKSSKVFSSDVEVYYDADNGDSKDTTEKSTTVKLNVGNFADIVKKVEFADKVTSDETTSTSYTDLSKNLVHITDTKEYSLYMKGYAEDGTEVIVDSASDFEYKLDKEKSKVQADGKTVDDIVTSDSTNKLTIKSDGADVTTTGDTIVVNATPKSGEYDPVEITLKISAENADFQKGTQFAYVSTDTEKTSATEFAIPEAADASTNAVAGKLKLMVGALDQYGHVYEGWQSGDLTIALDNPSLVRSSVAVSGTKHNEIELTADKAGTTYLNILAKGERILRVKVTISVAAANAGKAIS